MEKRKRKSRFLFTGAKIFIAYAQRESGSA